MADADQDSSWRMKQLTWLRVWAGLLTLWITFGILGTWFNYYAFHSRGRSITWFQAIRMNLVFYGTWALLITPLALLLCAWLPLNRTSRFNLVSMHVLGIAAAVCTDVGIKTSLGNRVFPGVISHPFFGQFHKYFLSEAEGDIQIYLLLAVIGYVVAYYSELSTHEQHAAQLETSLVRSELQVLKMQLQPHFLFNTLHSVAALMRKDPRAAEKMICSLGDLLRLTLVAQDLPKVSLRRELELLQMYLDIQRVRFQDRLAIEVNIDPCTLDAMVPYLVLQPLVENAIKHGVAGELGQRRVEINIGTTTNNLAISVVNDARSSSLVPARDRLGIGLENIRNRMRLLYGSKGNIASRELSGGRFQVEVQVPLEVAESPETRPQPLHAVS